MLRLLELKLIKHPIVGDLNLDLTDCVDKETDLYNTIIIGPNGTGKSYLLQAIVNIFRDGATYLNRVEKKSGFVNGSYYLKYLFKEKIVEIANYNFTTESIDKSDFKSPINFFVNGRLSNDSSFLPAKILASSMIFTDKFPAVEDKNLPQYNYLGVRNLNSSTAGTKTINTKVVDSLTKSLTKNGFLEKLRKVLEDLNYSPSIKISYVPKYRTVFYGKDLSVDSLISMFENWRETFNSRKSTPWGMGYFHSIKNNELLLSRIVNFLNNKKFKPYGKGGRYFEYDLIKENINIGDYEVLYHLHKLDLVSFPNIELAKLDSKFGIADSSSGEQNVLFTLFTILANVEDNSIILIDEPELSLHPNWQMQYFSILREIFKSYNGLHFLVATHSHFLISDVKGENSKIVGLKKDNNKIQTVELPANINTYGWSAEDVLYNIFNVRSSLNYYLQADLTQLLGMISNEIKDIPKIETIINKLNRLQKRENDPLQEIISEAKEYLESIR